METMGSRLTVLRISKRLSQAALAKRCGVSQPTIANIERGRTTEIKGYVLESLCRELSTTPQFILRGSDNPENHEHSMLQAEMNAIFRDLSLDDKTTLLRMARGLLPSLKTTSKVVP